MNFGPHCRALEKPATSLGRDVETWARVTSGRGGRRRPPRTALGQQWAVVCLTLNWGKRCIGSSQENRTENWEAGV